MERPLGEFPLHFCLRGDASVQALVLGHANLILGHVEPDGLLGDEVPFAALLEPQRLGWREGLHTARRDGAC